MFQNSALTHKELQSIQHCETLIKAAECLLQILLNIVVALPRVYDLFLVALKETNQQHIWSWLSDIGLCSRSHFYVGS